jgi:hypothetical protein
MRLGDAGERWEWRTIRTWEPLPSPLPLSPLVVGAQRRAGCFAHAEVAVRPPVRAGDVLLLPLTEEHGILAHGNEPRKQFYGLRAQLDGADAGGYAEVHDLESDVERGEAQLLYIIDQ